MPPDVEMAGESGAGAAAGPTTRLAPGTKLAGGAYIVASYLGRASLGELYRATEAQGEPVAIYLFDDVVAKNAAARDRLDQQIAVVAEVQHKNVARTSAIQTEGPLAYTVNEFVDGSTLASLIDGKRAAGSVFTPKGAYNVLAHLCNALAQVHQRGAHGMLWPGNVIVNKAGRVKITELGLVAPGAIARGPAAAYAAPELVQHAQVTPAADVYSAGAILYELLTGVAPQPNCPPPSKVTLGLPVAIDQVVAKCVNPDPGARFPDVGALKTALQQAVDGAPVRSSGPAPKVAKRPSLAHQLSAEQQAQLARPSGQTAAVSDTAEKWLVSKGKLDYGPFNLEQIIAQIKTDQVLPGHVVIDNETGERTQVEDHPLLHDIVDRAKQLRDDRRRAEAEAQHVKKETRRGATLYVFIAIGVLVLGAAAYLLVTKLGAADDDKGDGAIAELKEGELQTKITFPTRSKSSGKKGSRRGKRGSGSRGGAIGGDGFDDPLDLGDVSDGEDSERLDDTEINPVISRHGGKLGRCLSSTGSRHASVQFIIKGTGRVSAVKVNGQTSGKLADCIGRVMRTMKFPSFNGPRTKAEFEMSF